MVIKKQINNIRYSKNFSELLGIMIGDGHCSNNHAMTTLNVIDKDFAMNFCLLGEKVFGIKPKLTFGKKTSAGKVIYRVVFGSKDMRDYLRKILKLKRIPKWILINSKYFFSFCRGFFDAEGCVQPRSIHSCQKNYIVVFMQMIRNLRKYGFVVSYKRRENGLVHLSIHGIESLILFKENIGFGIRRKQILLNRNIERTKKCSRYKYKDFSRNAIFLRC